MKAVIHDLRGEGDSLKTDSYAVHKLRPISKSLCSFRDYFDNV